MQTLTAADLTALDLLTFERAVLIRHGAAFRMDGATLTYTMSDEAEDAAYAEIEAAAGPAYIPTAIPTIVAEAHREIPRGTLVGNINGRCYFK